MDADSVAKMLGQEMRKAREAAGLSRRELVDRIDPDIHVQTIASYERGVRNPTVFRLAEICEPLGVSPAMIVQNALQLAKFNRAAVGIQVDLHAVIRDKQPTLKQVRKWARNRLDDDPDGSGIAHLNWNVITELATVFGIAKQDLIDHLISFTPQYSPRR